MKTGDENGCSIIKNSSLSSLYDSWVHRENGYLKVLYSDYVDYGTFLYGVYSDGANYQISTSLDLLHGNTTEFLLNEGSCVHSRYDSGSMISRRIPLSMGIRMNMATREYNGNSFFSFPGITNNGGKVNPKDEETLQEFLEYYEKEFEKETFGNYTTFYQRSARVIKCKTYINAIFTPCYGLIGDFNPKLKIRFHRLVTKMSYVSSIITSSLNINENPNSRILFLFPLETIETSYIIDCHRILVELSTLVKKSGLKVYYIVPKYHGAIS